MESTTQHAEPVATLATLRAVVQASAEVFGVSVPELEGRDRTLPLVRYRQATMAAVREVTGFSFPVIGRAFGRDHQTVLTACRRADPAHVTAVLDHLGGRRPPADLRAVVEDLAAELARLRADVDELAAGRAPAVSVDQLRLVVG